MSKYSNPACKIKQAKKQLNQKKIKKKEIRACIVDTLTEFTADVRYIVDFHKNIYRDLEETIKTTFTVDQVPYDVESSTKRILRNYCGMIYIPISTRVFVGDLNKRERAYLYQKEIRRGVPLGSYRWLYNCHSGIWVKKEDYELVKKLGNIYQKGDYVCLAIKTENSENGGVNQAEYIAKLYHKIEKVKKRTKPFKDTVAWAEKSFKKDRKTKKTIILYPYKNTYRYNNRFIVKNDKKMRFRMCESLIKRVKLDKKLDILFQLRSEKGFATKE